MSRRPARKNPVMAYAGTLCTLLALLDSTALANPRPPRDGWQTVAAGAHHDVAALYAPDAVWIRIRGHVDVAIDTTCRVLSDVEGYAAWFPGLIESREISDTPGAPLIYGRIDAPWPVRDRDYVSLQRWQSLPGAIELETRAAPEDRVPESATLPDDTVRLPRMLSRWRLRPDDEGTQIEYVVREPGARNWLQDLLVERTAALAEALLANLEQTARETANARPHAPCAAHPR